MICWVRIEENSGTITGINDGSIHTFKERKYESLAREILQNSLDERKSEMMPVRVEFKHFKYATNDLPGINNYRRIFEEGYEFWLGDKQDNAKDFFFSALELLKKSTINILRISDFNTKGVLGSQRTAALTSADITPWINLVKSEGSSSKGGTQGGSFGIGKNATFASSALRTIFYSTYDQEGVKAYEGVAKLATIAKNGKQYLPKSFYGYRQNGHCRAVKDLINLDPRFQRQQLGTDIFVLGFEIEPDWKMRMIIAVLSEFFLPIYYDKLEVVFDDEVINHKTIDAVFNKYLAESDHAKAPQKQELLNAYNYYQVIVSEDTLTFKTELDEDGEAILKVLYNPEFDRKVVRTRETGMKLFARGHISSSIGFSGIVSLQGKKLNKLFRKMENPAHTSWSADNVDLPEDKRQAKKLLSELNKWIKDTIIENAYDKELDTQEVKGLGEYLPALPLEQDPKSRATKEETISNRINEVSSYFSKREDEIAKRDMTRVKNIGEIKLEGAAATLFQGTKPLSYEKGGVGLESEVNVIAGGDTDIYKKVSSNHYKSRFIRNLDQYLLILSVKKEMKSAYISVYISGEISAGTLSIKNAVDKETKKVLKFNKNIIFLGELAAKSRKLIWIYLQDPQDYALEVELYENKG